jgi:hypothetical protein
MKLLKATYTSYGTCHLEIDVVATASKSKGSDKHDIVTLFININNRGDIEKPSEFNVPFWSRSFDLKVYEGFGLGCKEIISFIDDSDAFADNPAADTLIQPTLSLFLGELCVNLNKVENDEELIEALKSYPELLVD